MTQKFRAYDKKLKQFLNSGEGFSLYGKTFFLFGFASLKPHQMDSHSYEKNIVFQQYTGLKDINGTEIYEGDLITAPLSIIEPDHIYEVVRNEVSTGFSPFDYAYLQGVVLLPKDIKIVGNIWQPGKDIESKNG